MRFLQITKLFYFVYTVYTVLILLISDYPVKYALTGLAVMWLTYLMVQLGYRSAPNRQRPAEEYQVPARGTLFGSMPDWTAFQYFLNGAACWVCTILTSRYYTGKGVAQVINSLFGADNAYRSYQMYFRSANIAAFSLQKIPYILMLAYLTIMLFWSVVSIVQLTPRLRGIQYIYVGSVVLSYLYFGVARGTNVELYTVFILMTYCILNKQNDRSTLRKLNYKRLIIIGILGCVLVTLFLTIVGARGGRFSYMVCDEIQYEPRRMFAKLFPQLSIVLKSLFAYLGFGIYTIGVTFWDIIPKSILSTAAFLFPGYELITGTAMTTELASRVEIGVRWIPDLLFTVDSYGFILSLLLFLVIGRIVSGIQTKNLPILLKELIHIILYVQMLSFPVGNFIVVSTSNKIFVMLVILCVIGTKVRFVFYRNPSKM